MSNPNRQFRIAKYLFILAVVVWIPFGVLAGLASQASTAPHLVSAPMRTVLLPPVAAPFEPAPTTTTTAVPETTTTTTEAPATTTTTAPPPTTTTTTTPSPANTYCVVTAVTPDGTTDTAGIWCDELSQYEAGITPGSTFTVVQSTPPS